MTSAPLTPSVSVALCTHNGERFLGEQLASILSQLPAGAQVVISDDASSDATVALATRLLRQHRAGDDAFTFEVLQNTPPLGVAANFAQAIWACTGDIVFLSDQDDVWHAGRVDHVMKQFEANVVLLHGDARLVDEKGTPLGVSLFEALGVSEWELARERDGRAFDVFLRRNLVTGATTAFRRGLADAALPVPEAWIHDEWLAIVAAALGGVAVDDERLVDYRQHGGNQIGAEKLSLRGKLRRLREPRARRNATLLRRAESLVERFDVIEVGDEARQLVRAKLEHERARSALPRARVARLAPVLRIARSGGYERFGLGKQDMLRDLVQPAG